jgi:hypothetical protein
MLSKFVVVLDVRHLIACNHMLDRHWYIKVKGKGHPITGHEGPTGGVEV